MKIILFFLLSPILLFSQRSASFETTFYFEDTNGNRDSIIVGLDNDANYEYNPDFGEVDITTPFDSVFEVRAAHGLDYNPFTEMTLSKKIVGGVDLSDSLISSIGCIPNGEMILFFIHAKPKYFPIKITWNSVIFNNRCQVRSFLSEHLIPNVSPPGWTNSSELVEQTICLASESDLLFEQRYLYKSPDLVPMLLSEEVEGVGIDTIWGIALFFSPQIAAVESPCNHLFVSAINEIDKTFLNVFPNPTTGWIEIDTDQEVRYEVFDITGKNIVKGVGRKLDISNQPSGMYFLKIENHQIVKLIKY